MADFNFENQPFGAYRVKPMQALCGIHSNGYRPTSIELTAQDLDILLAERPEKLMAWLSNVRGVMAHGK